MYTHLPSRAETARQGPLRRSIKREVKKKVLPRPEWRLVSRDPAHVPLASLQVLSFGSHKFLCYRWRHRVERATSEWWLNVSTMVLSEARGLWLFLVIRGGIT